MFHHLVKMGAKLVFLYILTDFSKLLKFQNIQIVMGFTMAYFLISENLPFGAQDQFRFNFRNRYDKHIT